MPTNYSSNQQQSHLNLRRYQAFFADSLTTAETSNLIQLLTGQEFLPKDILERIKEDSLEISYLHGKLTFTISRKGKQGQSYLLDGKFLPVSLIEM